jgi:hypothetical protein
MYLHAAFSSAIIMNSIPSISCPFQKERTKGAASVVGSRKGNDAGGESVVRQNRLGVANGKGKCERQRWFMGVAEVLEEEIKRRG